MPSAKRFGRRSKDPPGSLATLSMPDQSVLCALLPPKPSFPPVLYNKVDQLMELNNALACRRLEMRVMMTVQSVGVPGPGLPPQKICGVSRAFEGVDFARDRTAWKRRLR